MACLTCVRGCRLTKPKTSEVQTLTIGTIDDLSTDVYVYAENSSGTRKRFETTSDGSGVVSFDLSTGGSFFTGDTDYNIWVTLQTTDISTPLTVTVVGSTFNCVKVKFVQVLDNSGLIVGDSSQSISIDTSSTAPVAGGEYLTQVVLKGTGNTAGLPQLGDWKIQTDTENNLTFDYYDGSSWVEKNKITNI